MLRQSDLLEIPPFNLFFLSGKEGDVDVVLP